MGPSARSTPHAPCHDTLLVVALLGLALVASAQGPALDPELEAGIRQVDEGNFEAGIAKLDAVARRLKAGGNKPLQLSRAYLYLGIAHLQLSQEQAARARFADAAKADKDLTLSEYEFPPPVIKVFEEAKKGARAETASRRRRRHRSSPPSRRSRRWWRRRSPPSPMPSRSVPSSRR